MFVHSVRLLSVGNYKKVPEAPYCVARLENATIITILVSTCLIMSTKEPFPATRAVFFLTGGGMMLTLCFYFMQPSQNYI